MDDAVLEELWLPQLDDVVVEELDAGGEFVVVQGRCRVPWRACPDCAALASRVHSRYVRRVTDDCGRWPAADHRVTDTTLSLSELGV